jgi:preprotein translocase subunit SecF
MKLPIIKLRKVWYLVSTALVVASIVLTIVRPPKFGIDFTGGTLLEISFETARPSEEQLRETMTRAGYADAIVQSVGDKGVLFRLPSLDEAKHQEAVKAIESAFPKETHGSVREERFESIGPTVGSELRKKAVWSISLVLISIALFISYAFRKVSHPVSSWKFGVTTLVVALTHDIILPIGGFVILGLFLPVEINSAFIAAILTILGFSVHDTIVVFDRIRENLLKSSGTFEELVNKSVNETLGRSINTSLAVLFPLVAIAALGGESLQPFAFTLIIGLIAGTYSSVFLAAPLLVSMEKIGKK